MPRALSQATQDAITQAVTAALAAALTPAVGAPASTAPTYATKADISKGGGFPCTVVLEEGADKCVRVLRTAKRAALHGVDVGHDYRTA